MATSDKAQNERPDIIMLIQEKDEYVIGALLALYGKQEADEQLMKRTNWQNSVGFNALDAGVLSDIAEFYETRGYLTSKQISFVRRTIMKYHRQLSFLEVKPMPIKKIEKKKEENIESLKWAGQLDGGKKILIKFQFPRGDPQFRETLDRIKTLEGRKWNPDLDNKPWTCPCTIDSLEKLIEWGFEIAPKLKEWHNKMQYKKTKTILNIPGLKRKLYPFQTEGVEFVQSRNGRALIGDEMGLGKTSQALAWLQLNKEIALPALIITPATAKFVWQKEHKICIPDIPVQVLSGRSKVFDSLTLQKGISIINYDIIADRVRKNKDGKVIERSQGWESILKQEGYKGKTLILDEVHYTKNSNAQRTKAIRKLAKRSKYIIGLSGTPIINRPIEFFNCLNMIAPERFPSYWRYAQRYCGAKNNGFGWDFTGSSNTEELHEKVTKSIMIRRLKKDVLKELPAKVRTVIPLEINNKGKYIAAEEDFVDWIRIHYGNEKAIKADKAQALTKIETLKQIIIEGKMKAAIDWIDNFLDSKQKLVIFCTHQQTVDILTEAYGPQAVRLDGRDSEAAKKKAVNEFQSNNKIRLFIGNIKAAGVAITLTAASSTCFIELSWTPGEHDQAEDRIHRIGQEADSVSSYYLIAYDTLEEEIIELIDNKRKILSQVLDGKKVEESSLLTELLNKMMTKIKY